MSELLVIAIAIAIGASLVVLGFVDIASWKDRTSWAFGGNDQQAKARSVSKMMGGIFGIVGFLIFAVVLAVAFMTP